MDNLKPCPFAIGDTVYILGKYLPDCKAPLLLMECKISHIKHRQFIAYRTDGVWGEWAFSKKHYGKCVFKNKKQATKEWNKRKGDGE